MSEVASADGARLLIDALIGAGEALRARGIEDLLDRVGRVGARFLDPGDPLRREALERIPGEAGLSGPMAEAVLDGMAREWTRDRLDTLVSVDFPDRRVLDGFAYAPGGGRICALGGGFAFHVGAGNVPGVGATSLLLSLLVKCPILLKPGRGDRALADLFHRGLREEDPDLGGAAAVLYWGHGEGGPIEEQALLRVERVVAYGGSESIARLRALTPSTTPFVAYGPRISMGAVTCEILDDADAAAETARAAARAVALFDRRGCVSPQIIWVEEGGRLTPSDWAELLAGEMARMDHELPPGPILPATAAQIAHERGMAELRGAGGSGERVFSGEGGRWTLFFEGGEGGGDLCGGRTVKVRSVRTLEGVGEKLGVYAGLLQSLALAASDERRQHLRGHFAQAGFSRITSFSELPFPPAWWRHDGEGPLRALVRWVEG